MLIIALGHYSRCGKDSLANFIIECAGKNNIPAKKISFAAKLKDVCHQLYGWAGLQDAAYYETKDGELDRDISLPNVGLTPVEIWCGVGHSLRQNVHDGTWVDYLLHSGVPSDGITVVSDLRYPNEAEALQRQGAYLIKLVRPGYGPRDTDADRALLACDDWDYVAGSEGGMPGLAELADKLVYWVHSGDDTFKPDQNDEEKVAALCVESSVVQELDAF